MKIVAITPESYRWPRHKPITNGKHTYTHAGVGLVKIETDAEIPGLGLGDINPITRATIEYLKPVLIGEDPLAVNGPRH